MRQLCSIKIKATQSNCFLIFRNLQRSFISLKVLSGHLNINGPNFRK